MNMLVQVVAEALDEVSKATGAHIVFLPTYNADHEEDMAASFRVKQRLQHASASIVQLEDPSMFKAVAGLLDVMLAGRMHAGILVAGMGTPVVGMSYNRKFEAMFQLLQEEDCCRQVEDLLDGDSANWLIERLTRCISQKALRPRFRNASDKLAMLSDCSIRKLLNSIQE